MVADKLSWNFHPKKRFLSSPFSFLSCTSHIEEAADDVAQVAEEKKQEWETGNKLTAGKGSFAARAEVQLPAFIQKQSSWSNPLNWLYLTILKV